MIPRPYHFAVLRGKIADADLRRPHQQQEWRRPAAGAHLWGRHHPDAASGGQDCRPPAGSANREAAGPTLTLTRGAGWEPVLTKLEPDFSVLIRRSNLVQAATSRACEARQGQAPRGREATSDTDASHQRDHQHRAPHLRLCRIGCRPDRGERGRSPRSPAGGRAPGSIRFGVAGIGGGKGLLLRRRTLLPPNPGVSGGVGSF